MASIDNGAGVNNSGGALSPNQVRAIAYQAGFRGTGLDTAVKIAGAESARIPTNRYAPGPQEDSRGLWQINIAPSANPGYASQNLYDPLTNAKIAFAMSHGGTSWGPWTTYTSGKYLSQPAGSGMGGGGGLGASPSASGGTSVPGATPSTGINQAGYQQARAANIAGNYLKGAKSPFDMGAPKTGLEGGGNPLISSGLLTTGAAPKASDFATAQSALQKLAGGAPLNQHPAAFQGNLKGSGYTNPLPGASIGRTDMGVDANLPSGAPIKALGDSKVVGISPNWYKGQPYILMQLLNGPQAGKYWYVAEAINPQVRQGQTVRAGQTIGTYNSGGTGLELGWGSSTPGRTQAQATTGYSEGQVTPAGSSFRNFLTGLGA